MGLGVFKVFALIGFMGALFSVSRRRNKSVVVHFPDTPASLEIRQSDGSVSRESLKSLVETRYVIGHVGRSSAEQYFSDVLASAPSSPQFGGYFRDTYRHSFVSSEISRKPIG
jgi:hypothetical protein